MFELIERFYMDFTKILYAIKFYLKANTPDTLKDDYWKSFWQDILDNNKDYSDLHKIETLRKKLLKHKQSITVEDHGAGSRINNQRERKIADIIRSSATTPSDGRLLYQLTQKYQPQVILELGTSLGMGSAFMAMGNRNAMVYTVEGNKASAEMAKENFIELGITNIKSHIGIFRDVLPDLLPKLKQLDLVYIDGHHDGQATVDYYHMVMPYLSPKAIVILDDIYWSRDMQEAFVDIREVNQVAVWLDLFTKAILFHDRDLAKVKPKTLIASKWKPWQSILSLK